MKLRELIAKMTSLSTFETNVTFVVDGVEYTEIDELEIDGDEFGLTITVGEIDED